MMTPVDHSDDSESWDDERRSVELGKYALDAAYFITNCLSIDDAQGHGDGGGTMPFKLWPAQIALVWELMPERLAIVLKARQLGISWLCCAYELWRALFAPGEAILLFSIGDDEAKELLRRVKVMYERMPRWLQDQCPLAKPPNTSEMEWANGSRVKSLPSSRVKGSSFTASSVLLDEFAKVQFADDLFAAIKPTIDGGGQLLIVSTAWGVGNKFHEIWTKASKKENAFKTMFLPWQARPGRDQAWYQSQVAEETDPNRVLENYPANPTEAFRVSGRPRFNPLWIDAQAANIWPHGLPAKMLPDARINVGDDTDGLSLRDLPGLVVYELPVTDRQYIIGADVSEGKEHGDYSDAVVIDKETWVEVAALNGHFEPDEFARYLIALSHIYNGGLVAPENNNHGHAVIATFKLLGFHRVYRLANGDYGWLTNVKTKPQSIDLLAECLRDGLITVRTQASLSEMQVYRTEANGATSAPDGQHDDRVMSWAIALMVARRPMPTLATAEAIKVKQDGPRAQLPGTVKQGNPRAEWNRQTPGTMRSGPMDLGSFFANVRSSGRKKFYGR